MSSVILAKTPVAVKGTTWLLLPFFSKMHVSGKSPSVLSPCYSFLKCFMVRDMSQALGHSLSCLSLQFRLWDWVSRYCCGCPEPGESTWLVFEMKQTEQARLFIRSKRIIVEKVRVARADNKWTACWCSHRMWRLHGDDDSRQGQGSREWLIRQGRSQRGPGSRWNQFGPRVASSI